MINLIRSEMYSLMNSKAYRVIILVVVGIIVCAGWVLQHFRFNEPGFSYGTQKFYYSNLLSAGVLIIVLCVEVVFVFTVKSKNKIAQTISFGYSRSDVFLAKLVASIIGNIFMALIAIVTIVLSGNYIFDLVCNSTVTNFMVAFTNLIPIFASSIILAYVLCINGISEVLAMLLVLFLYSGLGWALNVIYGKMYEIYGRIYMLESVINWMPSKLLDNNTLNYMSGNPAADLKCWVFGICVIIASMAFGEVIFRNRDFA